MDMCFGSAQWSYSEPASSLFYSLHIGELPFHLCPSSPEGKLPKGYEQVCHVNHFMLLHSAFHLVLHAFVHLFMYSSTQPLNPRSLKIFEDSAHSFWVFSSPNLLQHVF